VVAGPPIHRHFGAGEKTRSKLDVSHVTEVIPSAFPNGCHVWRVEIDPTPAVVRVRYMLGERLGNDREPLLVEGQIPAAWCGHRPVLMEKRAVRRRGPAPHRLVQGHTPTPRANDTPAAIGWESHPGAGDDQPARGEGCGEAGCAGAMTS